MSTSRDADVWFVDRVLLTVFPASAVVKLYRLGKFFLNFASVSVRCFGLRFACQDPGVGWLAAIEAWASAIVNSTPAIAAS
jgi:hypothetical protein